MPDLPDSALAFVREVHGRLNATASTHGPGVPGVPLSAVEAVGAQAVRLPEPVRRDDALLAVLARRRSRYDLAPTQPDPAVLSALLRWSLGPQRTVRRAGHPDHVAAAAPTAGGLPSRGVHLVVLGEGPLERGVHRVDVTGPAPVLTPVRRGDLRAAVAAALDQPEFATRAAVVVALSARLPVGLAAYPARHYRTLHVDAGVALQNLQLLATALDLAGCPVMGYADDAWSALLALPDDEVVTVLHCLGTPA